MKWTNAQAIDEWERARARLLKDSLYRGQRPAAMEWLLKFAQLPLDRLSHGDRFNILLELFHFCRDAGGTEDRPQLIDLEAIDEDLEQFAAAWPDLQRVVIHQIDTFLRDEKDKPAIFRVNVTLIARPGHPHPQVQAEVTQSAFFYQVAHLLCECGSRIRRCRGCNKYFLAGRTDKKWCSNLCQAIVYKREHPTKKSKRGKHSKRTRRQSTRTARKGA